MTWLKDITALFSPFIAAAPAEPGNATLEDHSSISGGAHKVVQLNGAEDVAEFLKDSPWRVTIKKMEGADWWTWQRVKGDSTYGPVIYLAKVSATQNPLEYKSAGSGSTELLFIPVEGASINPARTHIDTKYDIVSVEDDTAGAAKCNFPYYVVIPKNSKSIDPLVKIDGDDYTIRSLGLEPDKLEYFTVINDNSSGHRVSGIMEGVNVNCIDPPPSLSTEITHHYIDPVPLEQEPAPRPAFRICAIFDTSGSMGSLNTEYVYEFVAKNFAGFIESLVPKIFEACPGMDTSCVEGVLNSIDFSLAVYLNDANGTSNAVVPFVVSDHVNIPRLASWLASGNIFFLPPDVIKTDKFAGLISAQFDLAMAEHGAPVFLGSDVDDAGSIKTACTNYPGIYYHATDKFNDPVIYPPQYVIKVPTSGGEMEINIPLKNQDDLSGLALQNGLPLFISVALVDGNIDGMKEYSSKARGARYKEDILFADKLDETTVYHAIPYLIDTEPVVRERLYDRLVAISQDGALDLHLQRRALSLLAAWAAKGDDKAKVTILGMFSDIGSLPNIITRTYLAKAVSLFISDAEADGLLAAIKKDPVDKLNTLRLIALAGHSQFGEAFKFMMDHVWGSSLVVNPMNSELALALSVIFFDPLVSQDVSKRNDAEIETLAGIKWSAQSLQEAFEIFNGRILPVMTPGLQSVASAMTSFALQVLRPQWVKGEEIVLNPIPENRYYYTIPQNGVDIQLSNIVQTARWEDAWIYFEKGEKPFLFETGLLQNEGSAVNKTDWNFIEATLPKNDDGLLVVHYHIHPWGDVSMPVSLSALPSSADLYGGWLSFLLELRKRHKGATAEFRIVSPRRITRVIPGDKLIKLVDEALSTGATGQQSRLAEAINEYMYYLGKVQGYYNVEEINKKLNGFFTVEFVSKGANHGN